MFVGTVLTWAPRHRGMRAPVVTTCAGILGTRWHYRRMSMAEISVHSRSAVAGKPSARRAIVDMHRLAWERRIKKGRIGAVERRNIYRENSMYYRG